MPDVKKILVVTQCYPPAVGGIETLMQGLVDALSYEGHVCDVIADGRGISNRQVTYFTGFKPLRRLRKKRAVATKLLERSYDAIFCDSWKSVQSIPETHIPIICLAHGSEVLPDVSDKKKIRITQSFSRAAMIVPNSAFTATLVSNFCDKNKIQIITPGISFVEHPTDPAFSVDGSPVITTICRLEKRKGIDKLIEAIPEIKKHYPFVRLIIAGSGEYLSDLEELAKDYKQHIVFLGKISEVEKADLLRKTDVFAMPVRQEEKSVEGFGLVYLEAALYGVPSLAGLAGGASDAVLDGKTGYICDGDDLNDIIEKLLKLLATNKSDWSANLADHVAQALWPRKINEYLCLLKSVQKAKVE
jgi:glycosyltransferase involved in cell wall biosynthesis